MNRKGMDAVSLLPFIFLLFLVGAGIAIGTGSFYGRSYEFRDIESQTLANIVRECMKNNDFFSSDFDISVCGLNKAVVEREHLVYIKRADGKEFFVGVLNYKNECALSKKSEAYARCTYFDYGSGDEKLEVTVGSNQHPIRAT